MKTKPTILAFTLLLTLLSACGRITLIEQDDIDEAETIADSTTGNSTTEENQTEEGQTEESTATDDSDGDKIYTVSAALNAPIENSILVKGYIVGYINGNSFSKAIFALPTEGQSTNIILADRVDETNSDNCIAVRLAKSTNWREELNLYDNPELLHRHIVIEGFLKTYFRRNGLYNVYYYYFTDE